ncbi:MAG TPA: hypothetical protein VMA73_23490 [Streptosporangiaceae bacterium]|nr:hypothetical protein [Streptosporangiaceae bacterium]
MEETPRLLGAALSRRGLLKGSAAVGLGAFGLTAASSALAPGIASASITQVEANTYLATVNQLFNAQNNWFYCNKCRNLYYGPENGPCATFGDHTTTSTTNYLVPNGNGLSDGNVSLPLGDPGGGSNAQSPWRWCFECSLLYYGPDIDGSWCYVTRGPHVNYGSGVYNMLNGTWFARTPLQEGWRYCYNCKVLYWGGAYSVSTCAYQVILGEEGLDGGNVNNDNNLFGHAPGETVYYVFMS